MTGSKRLTSVYGKGLNLSWVSSSFVYLKRKVFNICTLISFQNDPTTLSVLIPAGNIFSYKFVLPITIVISWLGCFYIVYIVLKKTKNLNKKILWIILKVFFFLFLTITYLQWRILAFWGLLNSNCKVIRLRLKWK